MNQWTGLASHAEQPDSVDQRNHFEAPGTSRRRVTACATSISGEMMIDRHVVATEEVRPHGVEIALMPDSGDFGELNKEWAT